MFGTLDTNNAWSSEGSCTIEVGPGTGQEIDFYIIGKFIGEEFRGTTSVVIANEKLEMETEGYYDEDSDEIFFEWEGEVETPNGQEMVLVGEAELEK